MFWGLNHSTRNFMRRRTEIFISLFWMACMKVSTSCIETKYSGTGIMELNALLGSARMMWSAVCLQGLTLLVPRATQRQGIFVYQGSSSALHNARLDVEANSNFLDSGTQCGGINRFCNYQICAGLGDFVSLQFFTVHNQEISGKLSYPRQSWLVLRRSGFLQLPVLWAGLARKRPLASQAAYEKDGYQIPL